MEMYSVTITLRPEKNDLGRGSREFTKKFNAKSKEQAEDFGKQYFIGFLKEGVEVITEATLLDSIKH